MKGLHCKCSLFLCSTMHYPLQVWYYEQQAHSFQTTPSERSYSLLFSLVFLPGVISVGNAIFFHCSLCFDSASSGVLPSLLWKWLCKMSCFWHGFVWQESPEIGELNVSKVIASRHHVISQYLACLFFFLFSFPQDFSFFFFTASLEFDPRYFPLACD